MDGRLVNGPNDCIQPGDYTLPVKGYTGDKLATFFLKPNSRDEGVPPFARSVQHVTFPPHEYTIESDGTLTISPSISDKRTGSDVSDGWHGYLRKGVWELA